MEMTELVIFAIKVFAVLVVGNITLKSAQWLVSIRNHVSRLNRVDQGYRNQSN
jgi:hypothetical protein